LPLVVVVILALVSFRQPTGGLISPLGKTEEKERIYDRYSFEALAGQDFSGTVIKQERVIKEEEGFTSWLFSYLVEGKKVSGMLNLPVGGGPFPVVVMLRGYADEEIYFTGLGTRKAAGVFAQNGFVTLAPDFLGFGESDQASGDILEVRFHKPVEVLALLAGLSSLPQADLAKVFLWGHSNGGQIALSVLEISANDYPTSLWAPVTKGFPESVLTYIQDPSVAESEGGRKVMAAIESFLADYDPAKYSVDNYWGRIKAPLQVQQGLADELVEVGWSDDFVKRMEAEGARVKYYRYPGNDHNLSRDWETVVERDLAFFKSFL